MRTTTRTMPRTTFRTLRAGLGAALCLLPLAAGGCLWTEFDDLKEETWVTATGKPDNKSANWGVSIARVARGGNNARLAVIGASEAIYNDVVIGPDGDTNVTSELKIGSVFVLGNLALEPLLLSNPETDEAALVAVLADGRSTVIRSRDGVLTNIFVVGTNQPPVAATYMTPEPTGGDMAGAQVLVAQNTTVHPAFFFRTMQPNPPLACELRGDSMEGIAIRSMGAYRPAGATKDDVLVLSDSGKLLRYDGAIFNGCSPAATPVEALETGFLSALSGSQIIPFQADVGGTATQFALVQAHGDGGTGHLGLYRIDDAGITAVGMPHTEPGLRSATLFQHAPGEKLYVVASYPAESIDSIKAGLVRVYEVDPATGIAQNAAMVLSDARPEGGQQFGRSLATLPYNGKNIIAVAADNDVFLYFRTALYDETRQGR